MSIPDGKEVKTPDDIVLSPPSPVDSQFPENQNNDAEGVQSSNGHDSESLHPSQPGSIAPQRSISSASTSSTASRPARPIKPPPLQTSTATTVKAQMPTAGDESQYTSVITPSNSALTITAEKAKVVPKSGPSPEDFKFGLELGRGSYSVVCKAIHVPTSKIFAVKIIDKSHLRAHKKEKYATVELEALKRLASGYNKSNPSSNGTASSAKPTGHPGVIRLFSAMQSERSLYFVLELAPNGEILSFLRKLGSLSIPPARHYAAEIVDTTAWMHEKGVLHRDLKPENILLDSNYHIKITDFGSAKVMPTSKISTSSPSTHASEIVEKRSFVGTAEYVSPEVLESKPTSEASDFWAIGCILYQLLSGKHPFRGKTEYLTFQKIKSLEYTFPEGFDGSARDFIEKLLVLDPTQRLGTGPAKAQDLKSHPFFNGIDFNTIFTTEVPRRESGIVGPTLAPIATSDSVNQKWRDFEEDESDEFELQTAASEDNSSTSSPSHARVSDQSPSADINSQVAQYSIHSSPVETTGGYSSTNGGYTKRASVLVGLGVPGDYSDIDSRVSRLSGYNSSQMSRSIGGSTSSPWSSPAVNDKKLLFLLPDEQIIFQSSILVGNRTKIFPSKRRQLVLTDFPRLLCAKGDGKTGDLKLKGEYIFVQNGGGGGQRPGNVVLSTSSKSDKTFVLHTVQSKVQFTCDIPELKTKWLYELSQVQR